jgi:sodium-dependent dicarboxylate transporter 2/3/5
VVVLFLNRPEVKRVEGASEFFAEEKRKLGRVSAGERNTLIAFGVAIVLDPARAGRLVPGGRLQAV